ncbi:MAG: GerW family sporulation protein [Oscillospiraceae bacterium]
MSEKNLEGLLNVSLENIKGLVDSNSIIGSPITTPDGTTIIPVSKVSFGFASGGSDFPTTSPKDMFGGGSGGGVTISPVAFLVLKGDSVRMIQVADKDSISERIANMVPDAIDTVSSLINGKKKDSQHNAAPADAEKPAVKEETASEEQPVPTAEQAE